MQHAENSQASKCKVLNNDDQSVSDLFAVTNNEVTIPNSTSSSVSDHTRLQSAKRRSVLRANKLSSFPNFSSFERHNLVVISDTSKGQNSVQKENFPSIPIIPEEKSARKPSRKSIPFSTAFCSTPGTRADLANRRPLSDINATPILQPKLPDEVASDPKLASDPRVIASPLVNPSQPTDVRPPVKKNVGLLLPSPSPNSFQPATPPLRRGERGSIGRKKSNAALVQRLSRHYRINNILLNQSYWLLYEKGDWKATLLKLCQQKRVNTFADVFTIFRRKSLRKLGEGCFGEVFACTRAANITDEVDHELVAVKLVPVDGRVKFNGEVQKSCSEILSEAIVSNLHLVKGKVPTYLVGAWERFRDEKESENDHPSIFPKNQLWTAFEMQFCSGTLEDNMPTCPAALLSILQQIVLALAVAETELRFEHRDLHWGNVLIRTDQSAWINMTANNLDTDTCCHVCGSGSDEEPVNSTVHFTLQGRRYGVPSFGHHAVIIDFTLSRLEQRDGLVYVDLSKDPSLFESTGDYQFDIYRHMRSENNNDWSKFFPRSNVMWIHYLANKMVSKLQVINSTRSRVGRRHLSLVLQLMNFESALRNFDYDSSFDLVDQHPIFIALNQESYCQ